MPRFFRIYDYKAAGSFRGTPIKMANGWMLAGTVDGNGLVTLIGFDGNPIWQKKYVVAGKKVTFNGLLQTGAKIFAYGVIHIGDRRADHLLVQLDANGNLVNWANLPPSKSAMALYSDFSRYNIDLAELSNGRLMLSGWHNQFASTDHAEFFVINLPEGRLIQAAKFYVNHDTQIYHSSTVPNDPKRPFAYISGSAQVGNVKGLFAAIGYKTTFADVRTAHLLAATDANLTQIFASYALPNKSHLIAGTFTKANQSGGDTLFIAGVTTDDENANPTLTVNKTVALRFGNENKRVMGILKFGNKWLVTGFLTTSVVSFAICLDSNLNVEWVKALQTGSKALLTDAELFDANNFVLSGYAADGNNVVSPSLLYTDGQLASCKTEPITWELAGSVTFQVETIKTIPTFEVYPYDAAYAKTYFPDILVSNVSTNAVAQCPEKEFIFSNGEKMPQSPFLHLQAAGSLGVESTAGIHLRWNFLRELGDKHLPKGNYLITKVNFNKPDDFVHLYRIPYARQAIVNLSLATQKPLFDLFQPRWRYTVPGLGNVDVWFHDPKYASLFASWDKTNLAAFWAGYKGGLIEIELKDTLAFAVEFGFAATGNYNLDVETLSAEANHPLTPKTVTARQRYTQTSANPRRILAENLRCIRCKWDNGALNTLSFETYDASLTAAVQNGSVEYVGAFALSLDDKTALTRLEDKPRAVLHGVWKKYNEDAFVNTANYQKRWSKTGGLKQGVDKYLQLSNALGNPTASETVTDDPDIVSGGKTFTVSYLDMLQIAATDFHAARMLGMGYIDTPKGNNETAYIYLAEYHTAADLQDGKGIRPVQHLYMSLPTARKDLRPPEEVFVNKITYGLNDQHQVALTDDKGYTPDGMTRYVNVFAALKNNPVTGSSFWIPNTLFQASERTTPIFVGMEYRKVLDQKTDWQKPEIAHHTENTDPKNAQSPKLYQDTKGVAETAVLLFYEDGSKPSLVHRETDPGIHQYAAYPISIFSRSGEPALTAVSTDETKFTKRNTLMPPSDVRVQLIQPENPLILTSADEQAMLKSMASNKDQTLVRLTFNYTHIQDGNYDFGDQFEVFFRQEMPAQVTGGIKDIQPNPSNTRQSEVTGENYIFASNGKTSKPIITNRSAYIGGAFVHDGKRFEIKNVVDAGLNYPKFTLQHIEERTVITNGGQQIITLSSVGPSDPDKKPFMAIENMANAANWGNNNPLTYKIDIDTSQWTTKQEITGDVVTQVRGIWAEAKIEEIIELYEWEEDMIALPSYWKDKEEEEEKEEEKVKKTATKRIGYKLTFDTFKLDRHKQYATPNPRTEWYGGVVRVPLVKNGISSKTGEWRTLPIIKIDQKYDENNQPTGQLALYVGDDTLSPNDLPKTLTEVNFYPGYRCYLTADAPKGFHAMNIMPALGTGHKNTLIGLRTVDMNNQYTSPVGVPAVLMAQEVIRTVKAKIPKGPEYATPPDIYNKSTYNFSIEFDAEPFSVALYRTDTNAVLNALYTPEKVKEIKDELEKMPIDKNWVARWRNLVHPDDPIQSFGGYQFPDPDNQQLLANQQSPVLSKLEMIKAIQALFVPITKQPLLLRDIEINPAIHQHLPAIWQPAHKRLLFTDYTLDGGMNTAYFYFVRNIGLNMKMDEPSPILGPVQLVNTRQPAALAVSKVLTRLPDPAKPEKAAVLFELLAPMPTEKISKIRIYRAANSADALHLRSMVPLNDLLLSSLKIENGVVSVMDDFGVAEIPYGDPLYYRIVGLRQVQYKDVNGALVTEDILSAPSKMILANVVDTVNPEPPKAAFTFNSSANNIYSDVEIFWNKTTYKGQYFLFKMTEIGQWAKIGTLDNTGNQPVLRAKLADTTLKNGDLPSKDQDGNKIYHHFKIGVESTSGLLNLRDEVLTIG